MRIPLQQYGHLLSSYLQPQRGLVIKLAIALLTSIVLQTINPQIIAYFIDTAMAGGSSQTLLATAVLFIVVAMPIQILSVTATYLSEKIAWNATNALRFDLVRHCLQLDLSFHKSRLPGESVERVDGDVNTLSKFFSIFTINVLGNALLLCGIAIALFLEDWRAGLALSLFSLLALSTLLGLRSLAVAPWAAYRQISGEFFGFIGEQISGTEDIRGNGAVSYVMRRFYEFLQRWLPLYQKARFAATVLWGSTVGLFTLGNATALAIAAYLWNQQAITIGTAYLIFHYTNLLQEPIQQIRVQLEDLQQAEASIYRIQELLKVRSQVEDRVENELPNAALSVIFDNVSFQYQNVNQTATELTHSSKILPQLNSENNGSKIVNSPDKLELHLKPNSKSNPSKTSTQIKLALDRISFHLPAGRTLGLIGHTGSGKTTLTRLLLRFYDPQSGCIRLGDTELQKVSLNALRQRVGFVTQDVQIFQTTVRNNLTFFDPTIDDDRLLDVLEMLGLSPWLQALPAGLNTQLGAESSGLSAGQAQLLAFARVFLKNPGLVVLDEASSRLDPLTETYLERAIDRLLENRTGIIIAHRLQTLHRVQQILMLENGRVLEYGDRETLANNPNSHFYRLLDTNSKIAKI